MGGILGASLADRGSLPPPSAPIASGAPGLTQRITVQESSLTVDAVKEVLPAVVTVINKLPNGETQGSGSGVILDRQRGFVVTNSHVVEQARTTRPSQSFDIILSDGTRLAASIVGNDPFTDVAVLRAEGALPAQATLADSDQVPLGAHVVAIGSPGSVIGLFQNTITAGVVSAKGRRLPREDLRDNIFLEDLIQTDAAINPGNSGGPLVWASTKQVVGLNALVVRPSGEEGLGFAISSNTVRKIAEELIADGRVQRGFLGITYDDNTPQYAALNGLPTAQGVVVLSVQPGTPAATVGLRPRDVIVKVNGREIDEDNSLRTILLSTRPGDRVLLAILRDGVEQTVEVTLGAPSTP